MSDTPEQALERARAEVARIRAGGGYPSGASQPAATPGSSVSRARLLEWALIEPDPAVAYSTRRLGAPFTALKRVLLRLLGQYHGELTAQQSRFNAALVRYVDELEQQNATLEQRVAALERAIQHP